MARIREGFIVPSAAYTLTNKQISKRSKDLEVVPQIGDVIYGQIEYMGQHRTLENQEGRIHTIHDGTRSIFVFGHRYAPDAFEGLVPNEPVTHIDLLARSAMVGQMVKKNTHSLDCSRVKILGYVNDEEKGGILNTRNYPKIPLMVEPPKTKRKAKMILVVGGAMNNGKSVAAACCCRALSVMGHRVTACKVTGTASLKDILLMEDSGAQEVADFTWLGFPSTYMLSEEDLSTVFHSLDAYFARRSGYWVVEFADGLFQRETSMLLQNPIVRNRIHKLIYCARDAVGVVGGVSVLKDQFDLVPDAISGICTSAPLAIDEVKDQFEIPFFDSMKYDLDVMAPILL